MSRQIEFWVTYLCKADGESITVYSQEQCHSKFQTYEQAENFIFTNTELGGYRELFIKKVFVKELNDN